MATIDYITQRRNEEFGIRAPIYKVCLIGDGGIGKSKLVSRLMGRSFDGYHPTLGVELEPWTTPYGTRYNIWDMSGVDRFRGLASGYYRESKHIFVMWDGLRYPYNWIKECQDANIPYTLILNTIDTLPNIS